MRDFAMGLIRVLVVAFLAFIAFIIWAMVADEMHSDFQYIQAGWHGLFGMVGGLVAVVALVELMVEGLRRGLSGHLVPWTMVLLGGVLLISAHWVIALSLAAVAAAVVVKEAFGRPGGVPVVPEESDAP